MIRPSRKFWVIREFDGSEIKFEQKYPAGYWSVSEVVTLMQRLASRHLNNDEIIAASFRRNISLRTSLLDVGRQNQIKYILSIGENPHFTASIEEE